MTYAWNSEALYFSSQCKVNANMENMNDGHFQRWPQTSEGIKKYPEGYLVLPGYQKASTS